MGSPTIDINKINAAIPYCKAKYAQRLSWSFFMKEMQLKMIKAGEPNGEPTFAARYYSFLIF